MRWTTWPRLILLLCASIGAWSNEDNRGTTLSAKPIDIVSATVLAVNDG